MENSKLELLEKALDRAVKEGVFSLRECTLITETLDTVKMEYAKFNSELSVLREKESQNKAVIEESKKEK